MISSTINIDKLNPNILNKYIFKDCEVGSLEQKENTALYFAVDRNDYETTNPFSCLTKIIRSMCIVEDALQDVENDYYNYIK